MIKESEMSFHQQNDCMAHLMPDLNNTSNTSHPSTNNSLAHSNSNNLSNSNSNVNNQNNLKSTQQQPSDVHKEANSLSDSNGSIQKNPFAPVIEEVPQTSNNGQDLGSFISSNILTPNVVNQLENFKKTILVLFSSFGFTVPDYLLETQGMSGAVKIAILLFLLFILKGPIFLGFEDWNFCFCFIFNLSLCLEFASFERSSNKTIHFNWICLSCILFIDISTLDIKLKGTLNTITNTYLKKIDSN